MPSLDIIIDEIAEVVSRTIRVCSERVEVEVIKLSVQAQSCASVDYGSAEVVKYRIL